MIFPLGSMKKANAMLKHQDLPSSQGAVRLQYAKGRLDVLLLKNCVKFREVDPQACETKCFTIRAVHCGSCRMFCGFLAVPTSGQQRPAGTHK